MKIKIFSHIADTDGAFPVVLSNLIFDEVNYDLSDHRDIDNKVLKSLEEIDKYDMIYITDLNIKEETANIINENEKYKNKVLVFDHHASELKMNQYSFIKVVPEIDGHLECGATLFYQYLYDNFYKEILDKEILKKMLEDIRLVDNWIFQDKEPLKITKYFDTYGRDYFIKSITKILLEKEIMEYDEKDMLLFDLEDKKVNDAIERYKKNIYKINVDGTNIGVVFTEKYISLIGNALAEHYQDEVDIIAMIKISSGSVSYRGNKKDLDIPEVLKKYNAKGHKLACSSKIDNKLNKKIIEEIFGNVEFKN